MLTSGKMQSGSLGGTGPLVAPDLAIPNHTHTDGCWLETRNPRCMEWRIRSLEKKNWGLMTSIGRAEQQINELIKELQRIHSEFYKILNPRPLTPIKPKEGEQK